MPRYEYRCQACQKNFSAIQSLAEHEQKVPACPKCGSKKVEQTYSPFFAVTSKKSA
jgi:putative FmdB family regulatory protein